MIPASFDYDVAESVDHALELLGNGDAKLLAGGHSLIPALKLRIARPERLVDIGRPGRSLVRARCRRADRDRRAHPPLDGRERAAPARALPDRQPHRGTHRRSAGTPPRHDRRLARARRPCIRPARRHARARSRTRHSRRGRRPHRSCIRVLHRSLRDSRRPRRDAHRDTGAEARRLGRLGLPEGATARPGLGDRRRRRDRSTRQRTRSAARRSASSVWAPHHYGQPPPRQHSRADRQSRMPPTSSPRALSRRPIRQDRASTAPTSSPLSVAEHSKKHSHGSNAGRHRSTARRPVRVG